MKMLLLDVENKELKVVEANGLEDYYRLIGCETIDIVRRKIGALEVEIVCDDEGLFRDHPKVSAVDRAGNPCLYGNLLIASNRVIDGELTELTKREIAYLKTYIVLITTQYYKEEYPAFYRMNY